MTKLEFPDLPLRRPHLNQTNASFDALEPQPPLHPAHPALPFPDARLTPGSLPASLSPLSVRTLQSRTGLPVGGGDAGVGYLGAPAGPRGQTRSAGKGTAVAHKLPGLRHRALDGEGGVSRLLFPGTLLHSGRKWRCIRESWTSRLRDGAGWPHSPIPPITWNLHKRETRKCTKFAKGKRCATPRRFRRGSLRRQPPPAAARSKALLRSQDRQGWEGRVSQALPSIQSCPHSNPGPQGRGRAAISSQGTESRDAALSVFHTCPLPPRTGCLSHPRDRLSRQGGVRVCIQARPLALHLQAGTDMGIPVP